MKAVIFDCTPGFQDITDFGVTPRRGLVLQNGARFKRLGSLFLCGRERRAPKKLLAPAEPGKEDAVYVNEVSC